MRKKVIFIAGTDTNIGKTFVTSFMAMVYSRAGKNVLMQKFVQTGDIDDALIVYEKMGKKNLLEDDELAQLIRPYKFSYPASPHLASSIEGKQISINYIKDCFFKLLDRCDMLLVEGSGGIMVPITEDVLFLHLIKDLNLPVIIVGKAGLGTINHTLMTFHILRSYDVKVVGIVLNNLDNFSDYVIMEDNLRIIKKLTGLKSVFHLPFIREDLDLSLLIDLYPFIGDVI